MITPLPWLERNPTYKEQLKELSQKDLYTYGFLGYPVLQAADILMPRSHLVPVGKDNESHVELTREIARRFNSMYGEVFPVPDAMIGDVPSLVGTDGNAKMSKSLNNAIMLSDSARDVEKKVSGMFTDPARIRADIPGKVRGNPVFIYHDIFNPDLAEVEDLKKRYKEGKVGDVEVKQKLAKALNNFLDPIREKREKFEGQKGLVEEILYDGTMRMRQEAAQTLREMKKSMGLTGVWNKISRKAEEARKKREKGQGNSSCRVTGWISAGLQNGFHLTRLSLLPPARQAVRFFFFPLLQFLF
jgi:tryptophanyl-tRNA synthetase